MLTNVNVASYIEKRMKDREKLTEITGFSGLPFYAYEAKLF